MSVLEEIRETSQRHGLLHLGNEGDVSVELARQQVEMAFSAKGETLQIEMEHLRKLQVTGRWAAITGLVLMFVAGVLFLLSWIGTGAITGLGGIIAEIVPVLIFKEIGRTRASLRALLPDYKNLFAILASSQLEGNLFRELIVKQTK